MNISHQIQDSMSELEKEVNTVFGGLKDLMERDMAEFYLAIIYGYAQRMYEEGQQSKEL